MYKAIVNGKEFEIITEGDTLSVDGAPLDLEITSLGNDHYHILHNNKGFRAELIKIDREAKTIELKVNDQRFSIALRNKFDMLLEKMGMNGRAGGKLNIVKAPMPGLIIDLRVKVGDSVVAGDALLVLEAMKMENIIKAPGPGIVKNLKIKKGDTVEKGQLLVEF